MAKKTVKEYQCKICDNFCSYGGGLHRHLILHNLKLNEYYEKFPEEEEKYKINSRFKRKQGSPKCIEFYIAKGYDDITARILLEKHQKEVAEKTAETDKLKNPVARSYWRHRGFSDEEIDAILAKRNSRNLSYFVEKYGDGLGQEKERLYRSNIGNSNKAVKRIEKLVNDGISRKEAEEYETDRHRNGPKNVRYWVNNGYSEREAKQLIYTCSIMSSPRRIEYWMFHHGMDEHSARKAVSRYQNRPRTAFGSSSKWSMRFIQEIIQLCSLFSLRNDAILYGADGKVEKALYSYENKTTYYYDLCIEELNVIVEFHGDKFHPYPFMSDEEKKLWKMLYTNKTFDEVRARDLEKKKNAEKHGYIVLELWERSEKENLATIKNVLLEKLNGQNNG